MLRRDLISTAISGITVNKSRTFLTMLGIIIGVASVVLMVSMGRSFQNYILTQIASIGTNTLDIIPTGFEKFGGNLEGLSYEDFTAIERLPTVESATPVVVVGKPVTSGNEEITPMIIGAYDIFVKNYGMTLGSGRMLDKNDEDGAKAVAVIGPKTAEDLFGNASAIGRKISVGDSSFLIVGIFESKESALLQQFESMVHIPFSTARSVTGQKHLSFITLKTIGEPSVAQSDIENLLRDRHGINNPEGDPDKDDFIARSAEQVTSIVGSVTLGLTIFLSLVAAISLLVGGIGIMNIMLVSVTERTREIGLRKAVGARKQDILLQFLLEAISLTLTGGVIGIIIGVSFGWLLSRIADKFLGDFSFALSIPSILLAVAMAVGTGLLFGIYPAKRAADLSPMEALRYE
jgi:putative ABC transport system permease protein